MDDLNALAERLWEESELRLLSSPWTTTTKFEGEVREHFIQRARASLSGNSDGVGK